MNRRIHIPIFAICTAASLAGWTLHLLIARAGDAVPATQTALPAPPSWPAGARTPSDAEMVEWSPDHFLDRAAPPPRDWFHVISVSPGEPRVMSEAETDAAILVDWGFSFAHHWEAAEALERMQPEAVLPAMLRQICADFPARDTIGIAPDPYDRKQMESWFDRSPWVIRRVLFCRVWGAVYHRAGAEQIPELMTRLLPTVTNNHQRLWILDSLWWDWSPAAEAEVARIFRDSSLTPEIRRDAAVVLVAHLEARYGHEIVAIAANEKSDLAEREKWVHSFFWWQRTRGMTDPDIDMLHVGFSLLKQVVVHGDDQLGFELAVDLLGYVDVHGPFSSGATPRVLSSFALQWWDKNASRYPAHFVPP